MGTELFSGTANIRDFTGASTPTSQTYNLFRGASKYAAPRVLLLGQGQSSAPDAKSTQPWPPSENDGGTLDTAFQGGLVGTDTSGGAQVASTGSRKVACVVRLGAGAFSSTFVMDFRPGCYNLPPSSMVEVSVLPWGTAWSASNQTFAASCAEGQMEGAHVPTLTGLFSLTAGQSLTLNVPVKARAVDMWVADGALANVYMGQGTATKPTFYMVRDMRVATSPVYQPPWGPVEVSPGNPTVLFGSDIAAKIAVQWSLQP